jgi:3-oxoacyl-(acyl-carrier-protein) synthase
MSRILSYGCRTWGALDAQAYWKNLTHGITPLKNSHTSENLIDSLMFAWQQAKRGISLSQKIGVIYASTKGRVDDFIWNETLNENSPEFKSDPLTPVLQSFLQKSELLPTVSLCVSNACASSLSALYLANEWLRQERVEQVVVLSGDRVSPFVKKGFQALNALTPSSAKPFAQNRDGLMLGEAASVLILDAGVLNAQAKDLQIDHVGIDTEGYAVTRPSPSGTSLKHAFAHANLNGHTPDLIIAHGTATALNDEAEDQAFQDLFPGEKIPITGTKWSVGHTLGASGSMDVIAACFALKTQTVFPLSPETSAAQIDSKFRGLYLTHDQMELVQKNVHSKPLQKVLVSSLGFGGTHAIAEVSLGNPTSQKSVATAIKFQETHLEWNFSFPVKTEPEWKEKVDRWYQLDAFSYGLAEFYSLHSEKLGPSPSMILLASPGASNDTDLQFVKTGASSPGKFVHTLPNIRGSALCQVMNWSGPLLCLEHDPRTHESAVQEAKHLLSPTRPVIWVLGVEGNSFTGKFSVRASVLKEMK